jgi:hypothetical protein
MPLHPSTVIIARNVRYRLGFLGCRVSRSRMIADTANHDFRLLKVADCRRIKRVKNKITYQHFVVTYVIHVSVVQCSGVARSRALGQEHEPGYRK